MRRLLFASPAVAWLLLAGCTSAPASDPTALTAPAAAQEAVVSRHVDGDTVWLRGTGSGPLPARPTRVRLLAIDAPETFGMPGCFGREASRRTAALLPVGARVRVQPDRELRDRYGRLLLYVWTADGASVEELLLREGYARVLHVPPNSRHLAPLRAVEERARAGGRGLWGACPAGPRSTVDLP
jgi:endonuclease YncB( thermonuclease family)